ncbi:MAG: lipoyl(octanoyl) transferase LipB [Chloroflexi bacterium]|nr:lipoyl(octanoyl) transferase LipB [Chloroflexota bacterium]
MWLADLGTVEYGAAYVLQRRLVERRDAGAIPDTLLLLEHPPTITLGRRGSRDDVYLDDQSLAEQGFAIFETNRGGLVTYHGPGQIVGYPIVGLRALAGDAPRYVTGLEETIITTLADFGITAHREAGNRGVFAEGGKIAAIGVAVSHGITMHGFALNVQPNLDHFSLINPCGIGDRGVTSMARLLGRAVELASVRAALARHFGEVFARAVEPAPDRFWQLGFTAPEARAAAG